MAQTTLANTIIPEVFANYVTNLSTKTNRLITSGILTPDPSLGGQLLAPGDMINMPYINDIADASDAQAWTDTEDIAVDNLTTGEQWAFKFRQAKSFGWTDISQLVSGAPIQATAASRFGTYWNHQDQKLLLALLTGIFDNSKIATAKLYDGTTGSDTFGPKGFLAAISRMGDLQDQSFAKILVNSAVYSEMKAQQMLDTNIQPNQQVTPFGTYNGMTIVVDDDLPVYKDGSTVSYIIGNGAIGYSTAQPGNAVEVYREPQKQGGRESIINRRVVTMHVLGTSAAKAFKPAGQTATMDEIKKGTTWDSIVDPRNIRVVQYKAKVDKEFIPATAPEAPSKG